MPYLVDTNVVLWAWHAPHKARRDHLELLERESDVYVSVASIWEISIKAAIGKLRTVDNVADALIATGYQILPIKIEHAEAVRFLPLHHRDPFDRLLIAQARIEGMTLMATNRKFSRYDVALA